MIVNLKTAKAIGIELPTSILLRADAASNDGRSMTALGQNRPGATIASSPLHLDKQTSAAAAGSSG
jgi:hypothetical protein